MRKVDLLIVSYGMLPLPRPRSYQIAKLLKNIKSSFFIITSDYSGEKNLDFSLNGYFPCEGENIYRVKDNSRTSFITRVLFQILPFLKEVPDTHWLWAWSVTAEARPLLKVIKPSAIVAFSRPETDLLIGVKLKKMFGVPLVVHFSDPWVANPYREYSRLTGKINSALEARVMSAADLILFTNEDQKELVMRKYPAPLRRKARSIAHCFDETLYAPVSNRAQKFTIRHIGNLYKQRTAEPFLEAVSLLIEHNPELRNEILVEFYGQLSDQAQKAIRESSLSDIVKMKGSVPYLERLNLMSSADLLLLIDADFRKNIFFPSKLVDYIGAKTKIMGITGTPGPSATVIRAYGGHVFRHDQVEGIKESLLELIKVRRPLEPNSEERGKYYAGVVARDFEREIHAIMPPA